MPTPAVPDLRTALDSATREPRWWSTPAARLVLEDALAALTPLARHFQADPADALSYAFEVWHTIAPELIVDENVDLWAYTRTAVHHALAREVTAAKKVTSTTAARRTDATALDLIVGLDGFDRGIDPFEDTDDAPVQLPAQGARALAALEQVLVAAGLSADDRAIFVDVFADIVASTDNIRTRLSRAEAVRDLLGTHLSVGQWKALCEIVLGTPGGRAGILRLTADGHPAPVMEPHVATRLMQLLQVSP
ncbi:hypothetical protein [Microbacterium sp. 77mftsu3.1]|uniref:hypothetical protein n=1 Tax=Microbacterium sp. 77mftsu3.1 TaxID=1761802 RepID=UPI000372C118|nr:hypothetical protein [Microbacterium sp. 77mftsu3.1]SDH50756.1 hypothetical protein SAMN04488590_3475 [Microbacterium sp. 77mftsu3.1]